MKEMAYSFLCWSELSIMVFGKKEELNMIKNIVFDVGNVLVYFRWKELMEELSFSEEIIHKLEKDMINNPYWKEFDRGGMPEEDIINEFKKANQGLEKEIDLFFSNKENVVRQYEYTQNWLKELKRRGYHLYYLSNYQKSFWELHKKRRFAWYPLMEGGIVSACVQLIKPDHAIYRKLLETYDLKPEECVFLDDTKENIEAAKEVGMYGIWFQEYEQASKELNEILQKSRG